MGGRRLDPVRARVLAECLDAGMNPNWAAAAAGVSKSLAYQVDRERSGASRLAVRRAAAACPLTGVMEDQIRARLAGLPGIDGFRVDWVWLPAWQPRDITVSGREQLHAIGFTI